MKDTQNNEENQSKIEEKDKVICEYSDTLKRLQAEFENYVKRVEREKQELTTYSTHKLANKLLTVADHFDKAIDALKDSESVQGIEMIKKEFHRVLREEGVEAINAVGEKLDPFKHEVIDVIIGEKDDVVIGEIQKGYMFKNKVLRPSKVRISKTKEEN